jgi:putative endonuclease
MFLYCSPAKAGAQYRSAQDGEQGFVYIIASSRNGMIYIGVTSDLPKRIWEHRNDVVAGFTRKHRFHLLVWYQAFDSLEFARRRELQMKERKRSWKLREIDGFNPEWEDLYEGVALP